MFTKNQINLEILVNILKPAVIMFLTAYLPACPESTYLRSTTMNMLTNIACYNIPEYHLTMANSFFLPSTKSIFFIESSCKGGLNSRQACAVESTARAHPNWQVTVLFPGPLQNRFRKTLLFLKLTLALDVDFIRINVSDFAKYTPLENLFTKDFLKRSKYPVVHSSDLLRILFLYKYGGIYLDLDVIVMKSFDTLPKNFVARESYDSVASSVLAFSRDGLGREFLKIAVSDLARSFNLNSWAYNGPGLITRTLKKVCRVKDVPHMNNSTCKGFHILDEELFFPVPSKYRMEYFKERHSLYSEAYAHHVWNSATHDLRPHRNSFYANLAKKYCPTVYNLYEDEFGI